MFYIRADGNAQTGAGHIMRCLTIAEEIKKKEQVTFLCADALSAALAQSYGYASIVLGKLPFSEEEAVRIMEVLRQEADNSPRFLIDSYLAAPAYVERLAALGRTAFLDDMCREAFPADVIINYNAFAEREAYRALYGQTAGLQQEGVSGEQMEAAQKCPTFLLGCDYIPIRQQFADRRAILRKKPEAILITTGGGDKDNLTGAILEELLRTEAVGELTMHVVSGAFNPHMQTLAELAEKHANIQVHKNVTDMAGLMCACDAAVTAGGTTVYELCALGVPFVCFSYAENQDALVSYIGERHITASAGSMAFGGVSRRSKVLAKIGALTAKLVEDADYRKECQKREVRLVDGCGAARIAGVLLDM